MAAKVGVVKVTTPNGGSNGQTQDITFSGLGDFKMAMFILTDSGTLGSAQTNALMMVGFCDSAGNQTVHSAGCRDQISPNRITGAGFRANDACILVPDLPNAGAAAIVLAEADFDSTVTDGVRIIWTTVTPSSLEMTVILWGGSDVDAEVGTATITTSGTSVTNSGAWEPDQVFMLAKAGTFTLPRTSDNDGPSMSIGFADNDGSTVVQGSIGFAFPEVSTIQTTESKAIVSNTKIASVLSGTLGDTSTNNSITLNSFDADGFTATQDVSSSGTVSYAMVSYGDAMYLHDQSVETINTTAAPFTQAFTSFGFAPTDCTLTLSTRLTSFNTITASSEGGAIAISAFSSSAARAICPSSEHGLDMTVSPPNANSYVDDLAYLLTLDDGTTGTGAVEATLSSYSGSGYTLSFSTNDESTGHVFLALGMGPDNPILVVDDGLDISEDYLLVQMHILAQGETLLLSEVDQLFTTAAVFEAGAAGLQAGSVQQGEVASGGAQEGGIA